MKKYLWILLILLAISLLTVNIFLIVKNSGNTSKENTAPDLIVEPKVIPVCSRSDPYKNSPEFERGLSLLYQRIEENPKAPYVSAQERQTMDLILKIRNCLNIQYGETNKNTEGYFIFDQDSKTDNLKIFVSKKNSGYDDALTALLLTHEVTHAAQFVNQKINGVEISCIDKEVEAIKMELQLIRFFNDEEQRSLGSRVNSEEEQERMGYSREDSSLTGIRELFEINVNTGSECSDISGNSDFSKQLKEDCVDRSKTKYIKKLVMENPYYQEQCSE